MDKRTILARVRQATYNPSMTLQRAIERYLQGESMQVLAVELGVSRSALYRWMMVRSGGPDQWVDVKRAAVIHRIAEADEALAGASTREEIARAREQCRYARMDYERLFPADYGPHVQVTQTGPAAIDLGLGRVLDATGATIEEREDLEEEAPTGTPERETTDRENLERETTYGGTTYRGLPEGNTPDKGIPEGNSPNRTGRSRHLQKPPTSPTPKRSRRTPDRPPTGP